MTSNTERYSIVVGIDFEKTGDEALAEALRLAREHANAELHLTHVVPASETQDAAEIARLSKGIEGSGKALRERAVTLANKLFPEDEWEQDLVFHVRLGAPADAIHQVAIDYDANLIIVGTHARKGLEKLMLGSVAERLLRVSRFPVLVARERDLSGLTKSASKPDPARPGEPLAAGEHVVSERVVFGRVGGHISGLL